MDTDTGMQADAAAWSRAKGVTALRTVIVAGVLIAIGVPAVLISVAVSGAEGWEDLQAIVGSMLVFGVALAYAAVIFWWLDHLIARRGARVALAVHTATGLVFAAIVAIPDGSGFNDATEKAVGIVSIAGAFLVAAAVAGFVRRSFPPRA